MRPAFILTAALTLFLSSSASAERFKYRFAKGQVVQSRAGVAGAMLLSQGGGEPAKMQFRVSLKSVQRVLSVAGGVVTLEITDTPTTGKMTAFGQTQEYGKSPTRSLVKLTERGRFISRKETGGGAGAARGGVELASPGSLDAADVLYGLNFPDRDLQPGDTWEETLTVGTAEEPQRVHVASKFVGRETVKGRDCAKFQTTLTMALPRESATGEGDAVVGKLSGTVTTYFDPKAGVEIYSSASLVMVSREALSGAGLGLSPAVSVTKINTVQTLVSVK